MPNPPASFAPGFAPDLPLDAVRFLSEQSETKDRSLA